MVDHSALYDKLEDLTDLEVAILLCLIAQEHGIIDTDLETIDDLGNELSLVVENTFGLSNVVLDCSPHTSLEEFSNAILTHDRDKSEGRRSRHSQSSADADGYLESISFHSNNTSREKQKLRLSQSRQDDRKVVNVIIAKNFNLTPEEVQIQALENDHIFLSHFHDRADGFANLEDDSGWISDDTGSLSSVVRPPARISPTPNSPLVLEEDINVLQQLSNSITVSTDAKCYSHNLIVFSRLHRGVAGGISATATRHFQLLARCLAPLQRLDYLVPSLIAIAAKKAYRHRIVVASPKDDRSLLYGSNLEAAKLALADLTPERIIEEVLVEVEAPL
ncbi:hypothetical protein PRK78_006505 [Emydomyces testavorans]|uniref:Magnesium chelatase n=1 Tax=Emydomyces testavorans TaxID=2070801 RepID=A0AAF0ILR5_9EURO|nr:hypothetical protein PRK78_006505 [Emydomyces testavorans]